MESFRLTDDVKYIISTLNLHGHRADIVGGPIRDFLLGKTPDDYDITTSASPEEIKVAFVGERTVDTGIKHGTVTLVLGRKKYEITTYRIDGEYKDSRHPESVTFTDDITRDLARRDFTMNAIAYNERDGITDPYGGREDISHSLIRAVGDPTTRFSEDALRILRAVRFSSVLGFSLEEGTRLATISESARLKDVSRERIYVEWKKLLSGEFSYDVLTEYCSVILEFLPALTSLTLPERSRYERAEYLTRFIALFYLSTENSPEEYRAATVSLKTDSRTREIGKRVLENIGKYDLKTYTGIAKSLLKLGEDVSEELIKTEILLSRLDRDALSLFERFLAAGKPYRISDLKINGNTLKDMGRSGREIGEVLNSLILAVIEGRVENEEKALLSFSLTL